MSTSKSDPLRIATIGLGAQMNNALCLFFQGPCQNACVLAPEDNAELSIVDVDGYDGTERLEHHLKNFPKRPVIVLSLHEKVLNGTIFIRKPVKPTQLFDAIKQAKTQLCLSAENSSHGLSSKNTQIERTRADESASLDNAQSSSRKSKQSPESDSPRARTKKPPPSTHRAAMHLDERSVNVYIGSAPDINPDNQQDVANAQYDPQSFLQSHLKRALAKAASARCGIILGSPQGSMTIVPDSRKILTNITEQKLRTLATVPLVDGTISLSRLEGDKPSDETFDTRIVDSEGLMWKAALWASRGRVPVGTSFMTPVIMSRWPNLPKLLVFPHALRVAALWAKSSYSLVDTAKYLEIPQRNVFAFFSAAHAIGLVDMAEGTVASSAAPPPTLMQARKGILNRIINRLRLR